MAKDNSLLDINLILAQYATTVDKGMDEALKSTAKDAVDKLKSTSPKEKGTYAKSWKVKKGKKLYYVVYNEQYQLTHLLEKGHDVVAWGKKCGRTKAKPHIAPVNDWVKEEAVKRLEENLKNEH